MNTLLSFLWQTPEDLQWEYQSVGSVHPLDHAPSLANIEEMPSTRIPNQDFFKISKWLWSATMNSLYECFHTCTHARTHTHAHTHTRTHAHTHTRTHAHAHAHAHTHTHTHTHTHSAQLVQPMAHPCATKQHHKRVHSGRPQQSLYQLPHVCHCCHLLPG